VDAGAVGDAPFLFAYAAGARVKAVQALRGAGEGAGSSVAIVVSEHSLIRATADLKGKRIATGKGSVGHYLLLRALETAGLTPRDVTVVYLSPGDAKAALSAGSVDAWASWNPYVGLAVLHDHNRIIIDGRGLMTGVGFQAANQRAIDTKHAQLQDFLARVARAQRWELDHKADYAQALAKDTGLPLDVALYTVEHARTVAVPVDASVIAEEHDTLNHFRAAGVIDKAPDVDHAFDTSFSGAAEP
jgi:sulfonate transport system substrate-binding protein